MASSIEGPAADDSLFCVFFSLILSRYLFFQEPFNFITIHLAIDGLFMGDNFYCYLLWSLVKLVCLWSFYLFSFLATNIIICFLFYFCVILFEGKQKLYEVEVVKRDFKLTILFPFPARWEIYRGQRILPIISH